MSRDEDDLTRNQGEDFEFESQDDDFTIPDHPFGESSMEDLDDTDDFIGNTESFGGTLETEEGFSIGDMHDPDEPQDIPDHHIDPEETEAELDESEEPWKPGWKTWLGLVSVAVLVASSLAMWLFSDSSQSQARQPLNPIQLQQMGNSQNAGAPGSVSQAEQAPQPVRPAPVQVEAFPTSDRSINAGQENAIAMGSPRSQALPDPHSRAEESADYGASTFDEQRAEILNGKRVDEAFGKTFAKIEEFKGLRSIVRSNSDQIRALAERYQERQTVINELAIRVADLEKGIQTNSQATAKQSQLDTPKPDPAIKDAQIVLAAYNYEPGPLDGLMGARTIRAIERFQAVHGVNETGRLDAKTRAALENPKMYPRRVQRTQAAQKSPVKSANKVSDQNLWYVRGVTSSRAIVFSSSGSTYAVEIGTEIPGMGQVTALDPHKHKVITSNGTIGKR